MHALSRQHRLRVGFRLMAVVCTLTLLLQPASSWSAEPEVDPLSLGVQAPASDEERLGLRLEAWAQRMDLRREQGQADALGRAALDFRREWTMGEGARFVVSDRLEAVAYSDGVDDAQRNALREFYLSGQATPSWYFDVGRVNLRQGVGLGYNPTDYLRENAVVMRSSLNPATLRENRLGAVMVRAQWVDALGSAQLAVLPQLSHDDRFDDDTWALDLERTNRHDAALLRLSPQTGERLAVDFTSFARDGDAPQLGANVSWTATDAWVAQLEWSGGRRAAVPTVNAPEGRERWFNRLALGASWTAPGGVVVSLERHHAGDALNESDWNDWRAAQGPAAGRLGALRQTLSERQDLLVRQYWFSRLAWDRAFGVERLDLSGFARRNVDDGSGLWQGEAAWHATDRLDLGLQVIRTMGAGDSEFGAAAARGTLAVYLRAFL